MRRATNHGFFVSLILNMIFRMEWLALAVILLILHFIIKTPLWLIAIPIGAWVLHALIVTLVLGFVVRAGNEPTPKRPNKNPYSVGNRKGE